jgi:hypothetical protein
MFRPLAHRGLLAAILALVTTLAPAAEPRPQIADPAAGLAAAAPAAGQAARDSLIVFGGPGTLTGKFQSAGGLPDLQGWQGVDHTADPADHWQRSAFRAANLDPDTPGNQAWWCGELHASCDPDDPPEGYGDSWRTALSWSAPVDDAQSPVTVHLTAMVNVDLEPGYDFLHVEARRADAWESLESLDGQHLGRAIDQVITVVPEDLAGGEVGLRFRVETDGAYSDADCLYASAGAAQIDNIAVTFDQGDGPELVGAIETAEPGAPSAWEPANLPGVGNFARIWDDLDDIDPCADHASPVLAFIDDGEVVPGTGGSQCEQWCYGPGGHVVNFDGGLAGEGHLIDNRCWSPPIALPGDPATGALLEFDNYMHNSATAPNTAMIFMRWQVDSTADPAGETGWSGPRNRNQVYDGGPGWVRRAFPFGDLLVPDARWVRIGLGVTQLDLAGPGTSSTPAPYFDNVRVTVHAPRGPYVSTGGDLAAHDAFPAAGVLEADVLEQADCAIDNSLDVGSWDQPEAGDVIRVLASPVRDGVLAGRPELHYTLHANPVFDPHRDSGWPATGVVVADSLAGAGPYAFDLPDQGFLFPGDVMHYFIAATQVIGGRPRTSLVPADTSGYGVFQPHGAPQGAVYSPEFTLRALPSVRTADTLEQPPILIYDRSDSARELDAWQRSLARAGLQERVDYDVFRSQAPAQEQDLSALGFRATLALLTGYETIIVPSGSNTTTLTGPFDNPVWDDHVDTPLIDAWLALGDRTLIIAGDRVVGPLEQADPFFVSGWLGVESLQSGSIPEIFGGQFAPPVVARPEQTPALSVPGYRVATCRGNGPFVLHTGPGRLATFAATTATVLAEFTGADHAPGTYADDAVSVQDHPASDSRVITVGHGLARVVSDGHHGAPESPVPAATLLVGALLELAGQEGPSAPVAAPQLGGQLAMSAHPNPFNPRVTLELAVPAAGRAVVEVFDLRGRRVRRLLAGELARGRHAVTWDGADDQGRAVGAGVYVARLRAGGEERRKKLVLLK